MGMYTELYLSVDLKGNTPKKLIDEIKSQDNRFWGIGGHSYYFGGLPVFDLQYDDISKQYKLTMKFNMKNYGNEIEEMIDILEPYMERQGHIGHKRYEENETPTLLFFTGKKVVEITTEIDFTNFFELMNKE